MNLDQVISLWSAIGIWFSGIATVCAVVAAIHFAKKAEKVKLKAIAEIFYASEEMGHLQKKYLMLESQILENVIFP